MRSLRWIAPGVLSLVLSACMAQPPAPAPLPDVENAPPVAQTLPAELPSGLPPLANATLSYDAGFAGLPLGQAPGDWLNVATIDKESWIVSGNWAIARDPVGRMPALEQSDMDWPWFGGSPPLSFMRYNAGTFGNGLPDRYTVDVSLRVRACDWHDPYFPIGDTGVQVYFVDSRHYTEVVYRPHTFEIWQCDGGVPYAPENWKLLGRYQNQAWTGQTLQVHASVSIPERRLIVQLPDSQKTVTLNAPMLASVPHWLTLRASNSVVDYDQVRISTP